MRSHARHAPAVAAVLAACLSLACRQLVMPDAVLEPANAGPDFALQGEYTAPPASADASLAAPVGAQIVALGDGEFLAVLWSGGLPGAGFDGSSRIELAGEVSAGRVEFSSAETAAAARLEDGRLSGTTASGAEFSLQRIQRTSPTLGATPPEGAITVFRGPEDPRIDELDGEADARGLLAAGATSHFAFHDATIHIEFRTPFEPGGRGQLRGNSGVYLQNRYELQILDSFGLVGADNECGGIYQVSRPTFNMAFPPLSWQTYDIEFLAARFDAEGAKQSMARVTVRHNGVLIQDAVEIPGATGGGNEEAAAPGPLYLQDHWNPVFYRNIWILPTTR